MSTHKSYGKSVKGGTKRNVLTRKERIKKLTEDGKWEKKRVTGLPKVKPI